MSESEIAFARRSNLLSIRGFRFPQYESRSPIYKSKVPALASKEIVYLVLDGTAFGLRNPTSRLTTTVIANEEGVAWESSKTFRCLLQSPDTRLVLRMSIQRKRAPLNSRCPHRNIHISPFTAQPGWYDGNHSLARARRNPTNGSRLSVILSTNSAWNAK